MTFLNNTTPTVLPDFQFLTSSSDESKQMTPPITTTTTAAVSSPPTATTTSNHIPIYPIPKTIDCNQYGTNIANSNVKINFQKEHIRFRVFILDKTTNDNEQFYNSTTTTTTTNSKYRSNYDR